jgi:hypothetical protein
MPQEGATGLTPRATRERRDAHLVVGEICLVGKGSWGVFFVSSVGRAGTRRFFCRKRLRPYICGRSVHERESDRLQYPITLRSTTFREIGS